MVATLGHSSNDTIAIMTQSSTNPENLPTNLSDSRSTPDAVLELRSLVTATLEQKVMIDALRVGLTAISPHCSAAARPVIEGMLGRLEHASERCRDWRLIELASRRSLAAFLETLAQRYANPSETESRICILLRIGLSSHEAATLLSMTERSFEAHCRQLRVGLALSSSVDIDEAVRSLGF
jgi:hypothetical protein